MSKATKTSNDDTMTSVLSQPSQRTLSRADKPKRLSGIDILKIFAAFLVVSVHFFLYSGFYGAPITDTKDIFPICMRWFSYTCVPLFMITTGYLMKNKTLSKKYYLGLIRIVVIYIIVSIICAVFDHYHFMKEFTAWTFIKGLFMFTDASYSWYVQYYICMFVLIPFVNLAFNNLKSRNQKLIMLISVFAVSSLSYSFFIGFDVDTQLKLFPQYFNNCYPFAYYVAGCYIREFPPKRCLRNKLIFAVGLLASLSWLSITTYIQSLDNTDYNNAFLSWHYNDYGTWPVCFASLFIFLLLFDITVNNKVVAKILQIFGDATLGSYLVSYVFDQYYYAEFSATYLTMDERLAHAPIIILKVFMSAMGAALVMHNFYNLCDSQIRKLCGRIKSKKANEKAPVNV